MQNHWKKNNQHILEEYLVYEDRLKLNTLETTLKVRPIGAYLSLIGVDSKELCESFKSYLLTFNNTKLFNYKTEQIMDEIISLDEDKTFIVDIYNLPDSFKIENLVQHFRFNRDFIPDKNIRIFILASNETLDMFSEKAYDFVTFNNFYGKFKDNRFDFEYKVNREKLDRLIKEYKELKPNTPRMIQLEVISKLIEESIEIKDDKTAVKYLNIALKKAKKLENSYLEIHFLNLFGRVYMNDKFELSLKYFDKALFLVDNDYIEDKAMLFSNKANVYKNMKKFDKALDLLNKAIEINKEIGRKGGLAINYANIGAIYHGGDNLKAIDYYAKSLELQKELNNKEGIATNYNNIGQIFFVQYQYNQALEYFNQALKIAKANSYHTLLVAILIGLGELYKKLLDFKLSLKYYNEAFKLSKKLNNKESFDLCTTNIKEINNILNGIENSDEIEINKDSEDKEDQIRYLIYESSQIKEQKKYNETKEKLIESEKLADEINLKGLQCEVYIAYYDYYRTIDDNENAAKYYNKANYIIKNSGHKLFEKRLEDIKNTHDKNTPV